MIAETTGNPDEGTPDIPGAEIEGGVDLDGKGELVEAICTVMSNLDRLPKSGHNPHQDYDYVQDEDVMDAIRPQMASAGLMAVASCAGEHCEKRKTKTSSGTAKVNRYWHYWFDITLAHTSGQTATLRAKGVAYSNGDKHYNQALQAAKKYTMIELFKLSSGDESDTDAQDSGSAALEVPEPAQKGRGGGGGSNPPAQPRNQQGGEDSPETKRAALFAQVQDLADQVADDRGVDRSDILGWYRKKMQKDVSDLDVDGLGKVKRHLENEIESGGDQKKEQDEPGDDEPDVPPPSNVDPATLPERSMRQAMGLVDWVPDDDRLDLKEKSDWLQTAWSTEMSTDEPRKPLVDAIQDVQGPIEQKLRDESIEEKLENEAPSDEENPPRTWVVNYRGAQKRCSQVDLNGQGTHDELRTRILQNIEWDLISHEFVEGARQLLDDMTGEWAAPDEALGEHLRATMDEYDESWDTVQAALERIAEGNVELHESGAIKLTKL